MQYLGPVYELRKGTLYADFLNNLSDTIRYDITIYFLYNTESNTSIN